MYERDEGSKNSREEIRTEIVPKKENAAADQYGNKIIIKKKTWAHIKIISRKKQKEKALPFSVFVIQILIGKTN